MIDILDMVPNFSYLEATVLEWFIFKILPSFNFPANNFIIGKY